MLKKEDYWWVHYKFTKNFYVEVEKCNWWNFVGGKPWNVQEIIRIEIIFLVRTDVLGSPPKYVALLQDKKIYTYYTENYGIFKSNVIDEIKYPPYSQIWRDHLLSISMKNQEKYDDGYFVCLYPFNNKECRSGIKNYVNKFLQNLEASFFEIYVEKFIEIIKNHMEDRGKKVFDRYVKGL